MQTRWIIFGGIVFAVATGIVFLGAQSIGNLANEIDSHFLASMVSVTARVDAAPLPVREHESKPSGLEKHIESNGNTAMIISEDEVSRLMNEAIAKRLVGIAEDASVRILHDYAEVYVRMIKPFRATVFVRGTVRAREGKLYLEITKVKYGIFSFPVSFVRTLVNKVLNQKTSHEWLDTPNIIWEKFSLREGRIELEFREEK